MREYIEANLTVIRNYLKKQKKSSSKLNNASIMEEFKEWSKIQYRKQNQYGLYLI